jgi:hypothetical protein
MPALRREIMLYPYSRSFPPRVPCALDRWVGPEWRLLERHATEAAAPPEIALDALARLRLKEMPAVRALFRLRGLRARPDQTILQFFSTAPFVLLEEVPGAEFVGGVLVPAAEREGGRVARRSPRSPAEFARTLPRASFAAIATFRADARDGGGSVQWTETWVRTRGVVAGILFSGYWLAIGPFSAWIRRIFLREARKRAERAPVA